MSSEKQLVINMPPLATAIDGQQIAINNTTGDVNLVFIQIDPFSSNNEKISGTAAANIRMNVDQLRALQTTITQSLAKFDDSKK